VATRTCLFIYICSYLTLLFKATYNHSFTHPPTDGGDKPPRAS
jgi:hypothetical protein